ncbi:sugar transferase [Gynurincola endophyticus]|jgi:lipopolysaccharide/colanic/teichoic acid biosynthesis glycosyltransferase|uniref:sugar transferase n=1 Tax=Gynurincola endophyticus TaxID=2479004 RepID=UPI0018F5EB7E|nr:sugar transferase [Gynurincola endophyticus]
MNITNFTTERNIETKKTYRKYSLTAPSTVTTQQPKNEFFYIGNKSHNIDTLIKYFAGGYAAESINNAKSILRRLMSGSNAQHLPTVIIIESNIPTDQLFDMARFLSEQPTLAAIPFVVEVSAANPAQKNTLKKFKFVDDIICLADYTETKLKNKINFLNKIKKAIVANPPVNSIEANLPKQSVKISPAKRAFDIVASGTALLLLSPVLLIIALAIRLESRGPIFYISKRAGKGYEIFNFFKFRTMYKDADKRVKELQHLNQYQTNDNGPVFFKIDNDPRITKVGKFLRNTSIDEIPQLINVLIGDMSLVGNRPLPLYEAASLTTDEWAKRFMAPAGITGLWQIKKRGQSEMSIEERISLDINYADKYNFLYDLWIMANTPSALIQKSNA